MSETVKDCHYPWTWMLVSTNGDVRPCCFASAPVGNLNHNTEEEIWNGPVIVDLRKHIKANRVHYVCKNAPCKFVSNTKNKI